MVATQGVDRVGAAPKQSGIRPFDMGRDLKPVADLIADAFRLELDERGAAALREVRNMSRFGGLIRLLNLSAAELEGFFGGFVWVEEGKVVGNITVQKADKYASRWQIANVAVAPEFRGRGISRALMERAIRHVRDRGGKWATLQVYESNAIARTLYDHLGFDIVGGVTDLRAERLSSHGGNPGRANEAARTPPPLADFSSFSSNQWQPLFDLANNQVGAASKWWRPVRRSEFQPSFESIAGEFLQEFVGQRKVFRRALQREHRFEAAIVLTAQRWNGPHRVQLWVRPEHYGQLERRMAEWVAATLATYPTFPVTATLPNDHIAAIDALQEIGLKRVRTLLTMRLDVAPDEAHDEAPAG